MTWLASIFERGGPSMGAIAVVALLGITIFVERLLTLRGLVPDVRNLGRRVRDAASAGDLARVLAHCSEAGHSLAPVLGRGVELAMRGQSREEIHAVMVREGKRLALRMRRGLGLLATLGTMSPFLGLLGTVLGIMQALEDLGHATGAGLQGGYGVVSTGVAEALVTTAAGIVVAVVLVLLHQALRARLSAVILEIQLLVEEVADHLVEVDPRKSEVADG
ncbi:MAG: MotA/TolQ/ExbB proton channel family protein [Myxococcales bacterium]|nr:MotA/TolQ/ExbB proton channel family protein [Myxococcales bacterium]